MVWHEYAPGGLTRWSDTSDTKGSVAGWIGGSNVPAIRRLYAPPFRNQSTKAAIPSANGTRGEYPNKHCAFEMSA